MMTNPECYVFGFVLDGRGGGRPATPDTGEGPLWLHFDYSRPDIEATLQGLGLSPLVIDSLTRVDTRPRTVVLPEGVLVVIRGVNLNPGADPEDMVSLRMWLTPERLITVRQRRLFAVQDIRAEMEAGRGPRSLPALVIAIIERVADRIADFVDSIEESAVAFEEGVESEDAWTLRPQVSALRRQTAVVRRYLAPLRDALDGLFRDSGGILDAQQAFAVREQSDRVARYVEDLDLVRERALVVQEELMNRIAQEQNARMYVLSIVAAIFLPITFITGLFGMNVAGLPGLEDPRAFSIVTGVMILVTLSTLAYFRLKRWF